MKPYKAKDRHYAFGSRFRPIRNTLVSWFLCLSLIPLIVVAIVNTTFSSETMKREAIAALDKSAQLHSTYIKSWFDYRVMDLDSQAESTRHAEFLQRLGERWRASGLSLEQYVENYDWVALVHDFQSDLLTHLRRYDYIYDLFLIDQQGNVLFSAIREPDLGTNLLTGPYRDTEFAKALQITLNTGERQFSNLERYRPSAHSLASFLIAPVLDAKGSRLGAFAIQLQLERLYHALDHTSTQQDGKQTHYLISSKGLLISPLDDSREQILERIIPPHAHALTSGTDRLSYTGALGAPVFGVAYPIEVLNQEWYLVSEADEADILDASLRGTRISLLLMLITALVVMVCAMWIARRLTSPLSSLVRVTEQVAAGQTQVEAEVHENNEIGLLAKAFNHMLHSRQKYEKKLQRAQQDAEQASRAKGEFLASMSHEIRTPMNGVLGMLSLLATTPLSSDQKRRLAVADRSARSLLTLINDILDFSKVDSGKLELEYLDFDLRALLDDVAEAMALQAHQKSLELILDTKGVTTSHVRGDPGRLRQILTNIINNAIKFTEHGEIVIRAALHKIDAQHWQLHCEVKDTGIGISPAVLKNLFQAFTQADSSTTRRFGGTGLGLAIVKRLCQLMQGDVSAQSEVGKGSTFSIQVKLATSAMARHVMPSVNISAQRFLVVDDNQTNRQVLCEQLALWGAQADQAENAQQALTLCRTQHYDIALLDQQMPEMDGATLGAALQRDPLTRSIKLVMMTSIARAGDASHFADLGFSAYFPKPATTSDIFDALQVLTAEGPVLQDAKPLLTSHYLRALDRVKSGEEDNASDAAVTASQLDSMVRLLVVEDNQVNQLVARELLQMQGYSLVDTAEHGLEALAMLRSAPDDAPYGLILMDCQMPELDGYETTQKIREGAAGERYCKIPIIALTANAMKGDEQKCLDAGMNDYLSKPLDAPALAAALCRWLEN